MKSNEQFDKFYILKYLKYYEINNLLEEYIDTKIDGELYVLIITP